MTARIERSERLDQHRIMQAWELYREAFDPLVVQAIQRHQLDTTGFVALMMDSRLTKYLAVDGDRLVGLAVATNDLDAWPLIEPRWFEHRWPDRYARNACWYVGFVFTDQQSASTFPALLDALAAPVRAVDGVAVMDYCQQRVNDGLPRAAEMIARRRDRRAWSGVVDAQHYVAIGYDPERHDQ